MPELTDITNGIRKAFPHLDENATGFVFSDTHNLKLVLKTEIPDGVEYIVLAGDIVYPEEIFEMLDKYGVPVIVILGNHDFWHLTEDFDRAVPRYKEIASRFNNIIVLDNETLTLGKVRFIGTTLWHSSHNWHPRLVLEAANALNDYQYIQAGAWWQNKGNVAYARKLYEQLLLEARHDQGIEYLTSVDNWIKKMLEKPLFHPVIAYQLHQHALDFLTVELEKSFDGLTVVVTHHPPVYEYLRRVHSQDDEINPNKWTDLPFANGAHTYQGYDVEPYRLAAYGNPLEQMFVRKSYMRKLNAQYWNPDGRFSGADIWIYGHLHENTDFGFYGTRFINHAQYSYMCEGNESVFRPSDGLRCDVERAVGITCLRLNESISKLEAFAKCREIESLESPILRKITASAIQELCSSVEDELFRFTERFVRITGISQPSRERNSLYQIANDVLQVSATIKPIIGEITLKQNLVTDIISVIRTSIEFLESMNWTKLPRNFENQRYELDRTGRMFTRPFERELIDNQNLFDYFIQTGPDGNYIHGRSLERGCWVTPEKITYLEPETGIGRTRSGTMFRVIGEPVAEVYEL